MYSTVQAEQAYYLEDICAYGIPSIENVVVRRPYVASVNFRTKCPNWVAEHYTNIPDENDKERSQAKLSRKGIEFRADTALPKPFRALPGDYTNTGYSRGHMATAASHNNRELDLAETFLLTSNIVPQNNVMNEGDWAKLERFSRELTRYYTHVRTVTGPLYLTSMPQGGHRQIQYEVMGKGQVHVPTHLFKIIYLEGAKKPLPADLSFAKQALRFRVPHTDPLPLAQLQQPGAQNTRAARVSGNAEVLVLAFAVPNHSESVDTPLQSYLMPLAAVEQASGLCLAPRSTPDSLTMDTIIHD